MTGVQTCALPILGAALANKLAVDYPGTSFDAANMILFVPGVAPGNIHTDINQGYMTAVTIFDNLGNANAMNVVWSKAAGAGVWNVTLSQPTLNGRTSASSVTDSQALVTIGTNGQIDPASLASLSPTISWDPAVTAAGTSTEIGRAHV